MTVFEFLLGALATHRLSLLVSKEDGPYWILSKLRKLPPPRSSTRQGLNCLWCVSVYAGSLVASFYWWIGVLQPIDTILASLAFSSAAIVINQQWTKG